MKEEMRRSEQACGPFHRNLPPEKKKIWNTVVHTFFKKI
jgi:hypothetical protein